MREVTVLVILTSATIEIFAFGILGHIQAITNDARMTESKHGKLIILFFVLLFYLPVVPRTDNSSLVHIKWPVCKYVNCYNGCLLHRTAEGSCNLFGNLLQLVS